MFKKLGYGIVALVASALIASASGLFEGFPIIGGASYCSSTVNNACVNTVPAGPSLSSTTPNGFVPVDTKASGGQSPQTGLVPLAMLVPTTGTPRNFLGNGALNLTQVNGTGTVTGATTSAPTSAALSADRWVLDTNVTSGAGRSAIVTSSPSPPAGFTNVMKVFRTSGILTQPICVWSAIPTPQATQLASQQVTFSAFIDALAGLAADNNNAANLVIISGTGTDQGLNGSWTASPAITPAWTGITTVVNTPITLTTTFARYSTTATIPATATEVAVAICFTPTATGAGSTDGFAWTGAQLEVAPSMSAFEVRPKQTEILDDEQFVYSLAEGAATATRAVGVASSTSLAEFGFKFPVPMYKVPTMTYTAGFAACTTTACSALIACTALRTSTLITGDAPTTTDVTVECTSSAGFAAAGSATLLKDNAGSGVITAWTGL